MQGSVGLKMRVYDRIFCFVNCHFAAHLDAVNRRNADFDRVYRAMSFSRPSSAQYSSGGLFLIFIAFNLFSQCQWCININTEKQYNLFLSSFKLFQTIML